MKRQIRLSVFETNSSSTHSITIADEIDYNKWGKGELLYNNYDGKFLSVEEGIEKNIEALRNYYAPHSETFENFAETYRKTKSIDDAIASTENLSFDIDDIDWSEMYIDTEQYYEHVCGYYETYAEEYMSKSGDKIIAFGYYGHD